MRHAYNKNVASRALAKSALQSGHASQHECEIGSATSQSHHVTRSQGGAPTLDDVSKAKVGGVPTREADAPKTPEGAEVVPTSPGSGEARIAMLMQRVAEQRQRIDALTRNDDDFSPLWPQKAKKSEAMMPPTKQMPAQQGSAADGT